MSSSYIVLIKVIRGYMNIYYSDGKQMIVKDNIKKYRVKVNRGDKNPILYCDCLLYPTHNIKHEECIFINIEKFDKKDEFYIYLLKCFGIYLKAKKMYIKYML